MPRKKKEQEETNEEVEEELDEKAEEIDEEGERELKKLSKEELEELFETTSRGINPTTLGRFLSSKTQVALERRDIAPQANLEEEIKDTPIKKDEEKKVTYELYTANNNSKYSAEPENTAYVQSSPDFLRKSEENKSKSEVDIFKSEEKKFTKETFGSTTFGAKEKSVLEEQYLFKETKDPKKDYKPIIKIT